MKDFTCEICGNKEFYKFDYPVYIAPLKRKIFWGALRRYIVNPVKFIARLIFSVLPESFLLSLRKRAHDPYKRLQSLQEVFSTLKKIDRATKLFEGRKILI